MITPSKPLTNKGQIMKFIMRFDMNNAAFEDNPAREVARILYAAAQAIESADSVPEYFTNVRDENGNVVGAYAAKPDACK